MNKIEIIPEIAPAISYAAWQNSVPLLKRLTIKNGLADPVNDVELRLTTSSGVLKAKTWRLDRLLANDDLTIGDCQVHLDPEYLGGLNEAEKSLLTFELATGEQTLATHESEIRVLARHEWGGIDQGGELVAAFVMPNDPAVATILKTAANALGQHGYATALDGYQSNDPQRAYLLVMAIWNAVCGLKLTYANPPKSFEQVGQKTRTPQTVLDQGLATCLDTSLLFAAAIEAVGLNPVIVMTEGHCFAGAWLIERTLNQVVESDSSEIRKALAGQELITFETTLVTHSPLVRFEDAVRNAQAATEESKEDQFVAAIDIQRARMAQIVPLASHANSKPEESADPDIAPEAEFLPLTAPPELSHVLPDPVEEAPTSASSRIDRWQRKLLDLTMRNRLLNFRSTQQSIPVLCDDIGGLEDLLSEGKRLKLISLPDQNPIGERDPELHRKKTNRDLDIQFSAQALARKDVSCVLPLDDLDKRLTTIYRAVRNDMAEGGSNTLYLAVGFLRWRQKAGDKKTYRAPLLLIPVKLTRKSSQSPFYLRHHEDEARFNATLIQLLKQDFGKDFSRFESSLPMDGSGVDVFQVLRQVRHEVRDIAGFEVVDECALGRFSFAKYLLWRDLVDRTDQLKSNRVVKHLLDNPEKKFDSGEGAMPRPANIDHAYHPSEIYHPLDADSTQLAAVMAVAAGKDLVLIGPPGTGKSQTIANMIAQCLAMGKSVLFVAEKTAALDVVHRRLCQHGLGDCCVELHSNKAERKKFLAQLEQNWKKNRRVPDNDWVSISERLKVHRDELNDYVATIHAVQANGLTAFQAFGLSVKSSDLPRPRFDWPDTVRHDDVGYQNLVSTVKQLSVSFESVADFPPLPAIKAQDWSMKWETELLTKTEALQTSSRKLAEALKSFARSIGLAQTLDASVAQLDELKLLARALVDSAGEDVRILFHKQFSQFPAALRELDAAIVALAEADKTFSARYEKSLNEVPLEELDLQWREAAAKFWPLSWFAKRKVKKLMQTYADSGTADPATDLSAIRESRAQLRRIDDNLLKGQAKRWNNAQTDVASLKQQFDLAQQLRTSIKQVGGSFDATKQISKSVVPFIDGKSSDADLYRSAKNYLQVLAAFYASIKAFSPIAGGMPIDKRTTNVCDSIVHSTQEILDNRTFLKRWTMWCGAKHKAQTLGLAPLAEQLESRTISHEEATQRFEMGYADWWIPKLIDRTPLLRQFETTSHENVIKEFNELDDQARKLASGQARRAIAHGLPTPAGVAKKSELGMLRHQMQLKRPSKSIRDVVTNMPDSFRKLAPCLLMSPLSIAQYLPAAQTMFDVVIFDEASQIPTWDAIGAIARGRQTVIVGDPKQLPPTNFFGKSDDEEDDETEDYEKDLESILDEALASGLPELQLNWHYRSRHEALIAFSNHRYYRNELVTFPAAEADGKGLSVVRVPDAVYDMGNSRTNRIEAQAIVDDATAAMKANLARPKKERLTFGVITFNIQQQSLIQDLFEIARRESPAIEWYFSDARIEPTVVKNLENVQGDERDVMYFSITFGPTETNPRISLNFGALNRDGGERRLNVAVTRARQQMLVYASFSADQLDTSRSQSIGLNHLRQFLEFAESDGQKPLDGFAEDSVGGFDSPLEQSLAEALENRGWQVLPQIGISGFRIDLGIRHPDKPGAYLAGVECDGATYHRSAVARDRDKTRQLVLEGLGWNILRVWSPDWWYAREQVVDRLDQELTKLLEDDRRDHSVGVADDETVKDQSPEVEPSEGQPSEAESPEAGTTEAGTTEIGTTEAGTTEAEMEDTEPAAIESTSVRYAVMDLGDCSSGADRFYDDDYRVQIREMAEKILVQQGPVRDDVLVGQIVRAHGFKRTGGKIRDHILEQIKDCPTTIETSGQFVWSEGQAIEPLIPYRFPEDDRQQRPIAEISIAELGGLVRLKFKEMETHGDPVVFLARELGIGRVSQPVRERLAEAIERSQEN